MLYILALRESAYFSSRYAPRLFMLRIDSRNQRPLALRSQMQYIEIQTKRKNGESVCKKILKCDAQI